MPNLLIEIILFLWENSGHMFKATGRGRGRAKPLSHPNDISGRDEVRLGGVCANRESVKGNGGEQGGTYDI